MSRLTRKQVKVRGKGGKVYQRSMMVQAQAIGRRASKSGKLHALNPWEQRHMEHVSTNTKLGQRQQAYGSSGPGSDHSFFATLIGHTRQWNRVGSEGNLTERDSGTAKHAAARQHAGRHNDASRLIGRDGNLDRTATQFAWYHATDGRADLQHHEWDLQTTYGRENVTRAVTNPNKWVR